MAKTPKKTKKGKPGFRNAAPRPHLRLVTSPGEARAEAGTGGKQALDSPARTAAKTAGGAFISAGACALLARQDWLPPTAVTAAVSIVGAILALGGNSQTLCAVGNGAMSAAGGQFGLMLIDNHYQSKLKKPANADSLPPGALESAYERARARLALASAAGQLAA
jgi:hypothetical protein